jgi:hypothetical protein
MEQLDLIDLPEIPVKPTPNNHLKRSNQRPYTLRFTVDQGPKFVGKRISISLETKDISFAERVSSVSLESLRKAGFILSDIRFGRPEHDFNNMALHDNITAIIDDLNACRSYDMAETLQDAIDNAK